MGYAIRSRRNSGNYDTATCKSKQEILAQATTKPKMFMKPRFSGKVQSDEATKTLKKGIAFLETDKSGTIRIGYGHGGLLGGLDFEDIYDPMKNEKTCKKILNMRNEYDKIKFGKLNETDLLKTANASQKKKYKLLKRLDTEDKKIIRSLGRLQDKSKFSPTSISGLVNKNVKINLKPFKVAKSLSDASSKFVVFDKDTAKGEIGVFGYKISDIEKVYHGNVVPAILQMKDGRKVALAPKLIEGYIDLDDAVTELENNYKKKADKIMENINSLANKNLRKVV